MVRGQGFRYGGGSYMSSAQAVFTGECTVRSVGPDHDRRAHKQYVDVMVMVTSSGEVRPFAVDWPDGRRFPIDEILKVSPPGPVLNGSSNQQYAVRFGRWKTILYLERAIVHDRLESSRWWVWAFDSSEIKNPV